MARAERLKGKVALVTGAAYRIGRAQLIALVVLGLSPWTAPASNAQSPGEPPASPQTSLVRGAVIDALVSAENVYFWERRRFPLRMLLITEPHTQDAVCTGVWQRQATSVIADLNQGTKIIRSVGQREDFDLLIVVGPKARYDETVRVLEEANAGSTELKALYEQNDKIERDFVRVVGDRSFARYGLAFIDAERSRSRWKGDCEYASIKDQLTVHLFQEAGALLLISDGSSSVQIPRDTSIWRSTILMKSAMYPDAAQQPKTKQEAIERLKRM
jgi:hypothetical protein